MTATFWTGSSLSFTNGSKTVTVNTGPSLDSVKANSSLTAGNYNEPVEVKSVSGNTITLYNNWPGSTGTTSATIKPSAAAAASAGVAAQQLITDIQSLVSSASATATANSFVKRDSNGRIKSASPSANDDVVTKGFIGTAATKDVGTAAGNVMEVGAFGYGGTAFAAAPNTDLNDIKQSGNYDIGGGVLNVPAGMSPVNGVCCHFARTEDLHTQLVLSRRNHQLFIRYKEGGTWSPWQELYHSGNTNFTTLGNGTSNIATEAFGLTSTSVAIFLRTAKATTNAATSVTNIANFSVQSVDGGTTLGTDKVVTLANSTGGLTTLTIGGLTGVTKGEVYRVTGGQAIINF